MNREGGEGLSTVFRRWSILAFVLESLLVIATFLFLYRLGWRLSETMVYVIIVVMVAGAMLNIFVLLPWYRKQQEGPSGPLPAPEKEPER